MLLGSQYSGNRLIGRSTNCLTDSIGYLIDDSTDNS